MSKFWVLVLNAGLCSLNVAFYMIWHHWWNMVAAVFIGIIALGNSSLVGGRQ